MKEQDKKDMQEAATKIAGNLKGFDEAKNFNNEMENRAFALLISVLSKEGPTIALSYRTLDKYTEDEMIKEMAISKDDADMLSDAVKRKLLTIFVFQKVVLNKVTPFKDIKIMEVNSDLLRTRTVDIKDDYENLRVIFKLLEKRRIDN